MPKVLFIYEIVVRIFTGSAILSIPLMIPFKIVPSVLFLNNKAAISKAFIVLSELTPFSNLLEASVLLACLNADFLTNEPLKIADSRIMSVV